jgi:PAS domain S-box-containing protein
MLKYEEIPITAKKGVWLDNSISVCPQIRNSCTIFEVTTQRFMIVDLIQNTALLISLSVVHGMFVRIRKSHPFIFKVATGIWFGLIAVAGMLMPFVYGPGVIFDGRSIVLSLAGLFGGGIPALISAVIAAAFRIYIGGSGVWAGVATIITCSLTGLLFRKLYKQNPENINIPSLFGIGILVHIVMLACQLLFPWPTGLEVINRIWLPVMLVFPTSFVIMSILLGSEERRLHKEQLIKEAESLFRTTLYSIGDGVITTNRDGKIERMNQVAETLTGWTEDESKGLPVDEVFRIINEETRENIHTPIEEALKSGVIVGLANHTLLITKEGKELPISDSGAPIIDEHGKVIGAVLVFRDQTEERARQKELEESEEQFRKLFEDHATVHLLIDPETGNIVNANKAAAKFYGWSVEALKTMNIFDINTLSKEKIEATFDQTRSNETIHLDFRHKLANGEVRDVEAHSNRLVLKGKSYIYSIILDISAKKELFNAMIEAKEKAEENNRLKTAFLANMSHEIRTPLNGILGFTSLLTEDKVLPKQKRDKYSEIINQSAENLMQIIDDILDISKLEAGQFKIYPQHFELNTLLQRIHTIYQNKQIEKNKSHLQLNLILPEVPIMLETDETRLFQIFTNLLDNAFKFTKTGSIEYGVSSLTEDRIDFFVKDTGMGIPKDKQNIIFGHFMQADESISNEYGGTGLGLAIVKKLTNLMGGDISVESEEDTGAEFKFHLPYCKIEEIEEAELN